MRVTKKPSMPTARSAHKRGEERPRYGVGITKTKKKRYRTNQDAKPRNKDASTKKRRPQNSVINQMIDSFPEKIKNKIAKAEEAAHKERTANRTAINTHILKRIRSLKEVKDEVSDELFKKLMSEIRKELASAFNDGYDRAPRGGGGYSGYSMRADMGNSIPAGSFILSPAPSSNF